MRISDWSSDVCASDLQRSLPLSGITVLDLSHVYNGPYAALLMALAGAEVIKIEPTGGEHLRSRGDAGGAAMAFAMLNSNKKSLALDLKSARGKQILLDLARQADVLVENFSPESGRATCRERGCQAV